MIEEKSLMTFIGWVDYASMMIAVHQDDNDEYHCIKYVGGNKVTDAEIRCSSSLELKNFLISITDPKENTISELLDKVKHS